MGGYLRVPLTAVVLLLFLVLASSQAQLSQPDLKPEEISLSPSAREYQGVPVHVQATVINDGAAPTGEFSVEISWRRVDKQEICGFERANYPSLEPDGQVIIQAAIDTAELTPGKYEVKVWADRNDQVAELNETNNRRSVELEILPPQPELHPISLAFDPPSPVEQGQTVRVSAVIENSGETTAGEFQVKFLRCEEEIVNSLEKAEEQWDLFASVLVPGLGRDEQLRLERVLDTALKPGSSTTDTTRSYAIKVVVDDPDAVTEQDSQNNAIISSIAIKPSELHKPELRPVSITFNRDLPLEWDRDIRATVSVINSGGSTASAPIPVWFYQRELGKKGWGEPVAKDEIDDLPIEEGNNIETATATFEFVKPGSYEILVWVDPGDDVGDLAAVNGVSEQNESNNQLTVGLSVQGSELHPQSIELGAAPVRQGDTIPVVSQIENTGRKTADEFTVGFFVNNLRFDTFYYQGKGLENDDTVKVQGMLDTEDLPPGEYTLRVFVDPDNGIPELDEANNVISTPLIILEAEERLPELHATDLIMKPTSPVRMGVPIEVTATIWNTGNIDAEHFQVEFRYKSDGGSWKSFSPQEVRQLSRGEKKEIKSTLHTAALSVDVKYHIQVLVDPAGEIEELDEGNNKLITAFRLKSPGAPSEEGANLKLKDLTLSPPSPVDQGTQVQVCARIANVGQGMAGEFPVEFLSRPAQGGSFVPFTSKSVPRLEAGQSITVCGIFTTAGLPLGSYEIKVVVDPGNFIPELDETDNDLVRTLIISQAVPRPDLHPTGLTFEPPSPVRQGQPVRVCVEVANAGKAAAGQFKVSYAYLLDSYVQFATATAAGLESGKRLQLCRALDSSNLPPGNYEIRTRIDPENRVAEHNEENNELMGYLTIGSPFPPEAQLATSTGGPARLLGLDEQSGTVYIASEDGKFYALEREAIPKPGFPFDAGSPIRSLALDAGAPRVAYLGTAEGKLHIVGLDSGQQVCQTSLDAEIDALGVDKFGNLYAGAAEKLVSLTSACEQRWEFAVVGKIKALKISDPRDAAYVATSGGLLYALGRDGTLDWQLDLHSPLSALALNEAIYAGTEDGNVQTVHFDGSLGWSTTAGGAIRAIVVDEERDPIYAASADGKLYSLDLSGNLRWIFPTGGPLHAALAIDDRTGTVFLGSDDGRLYALATDGEEIFATAVDSPLRSNLAIDIVVQREGADVRLVRTVYFGAENGNVYLIKTALGGGY